jgi:hypothetical protein
MEAFWHLEWSADGQWLLANGNGKDGKNGLHRIDPRSGEASLIAESGQRFRPFGLFTPAPDGRTVYWPGNDRVITALNMETLDAKAIGGRAGDMRELRVSPDGRTLAMLGENRVVVVNLLTGESKTLLEKRGIFFGGDWSPDSRFLYTTFGAQEGPTEFHRIPMEGGEPLTRKLPDSYRNLRLSPDGKTIAATRWNQHRQVWTLENFLPAEFTLR